ncbi:hypothetical protein OVA10_22540 [Lelliottia sp. SL45]|uniref:hypothetical protein n=1 Tax=Lelliottia sp. SL45 TaxID=2994665 RepID=UPI002273F4E4|nr:hypothetical protein [Lelliottia sp. SL45]MCY1700811.1 hypothetical protein [Lelliottia sp. SL45]
MVFGGNVDEYLIPDFVDTFHKLNIPHPMTPGKTRIHLYSSLAARLYTLFRWLIMQLMMMKGLPSQLTFERITGNADRFHMDEAGEQRNVPVRHRERQLSNFLPEERAEVRSLQGPTLPASLKTFAVLRITDMSGPGSTQSPTAPFAPYTEIPVTC